MLGVLPLVPLGIVAAIALLGLVLVVAKPEQVSLTQGIKLAALRSAKVRTPGRVKKTEPAGIRVWGEDPDDTGATWRPLYVKSLGRKQFRYGACFDQWAQDMEKSVGGPKVNETIIAITKMVNAPAGKIVEWLNEHSCVILDADLKQYEFSWYGQNAGKGFAVDTRKSNLTGLDRSAPPFPMPARSGWTRVWYRVDSHSNTMRSEKTVTVFWPGTPDSAPVIRDVCSTSDIRSAIRMTTGPEYGQLSWRDIASAGKDHKAKWWVTINRDKAKGYYK